MLPKLLGVLSKLANSRGLARGPGLFFTPVTLPGSLTTCTKFLAAHASMEALPYRTSRAPLLVFKVGNGVCRLVPLRHAHTVITLTPNTQATSCVVNLIVLDINFSLFARCAVHKLYKDYRKLYTCAAQTNNRSFKVFGNNPIRSKTTDCDVLHVTSMFYTLQGEGPFSGQPAVFIRMAGCNLACHFCDTEFEQGMDKVLTTAEVVTQFISQFNAQQRRFVVLTGGEPLRQNIVPMLKALRHCGVMHVQIETAGTVWQEGLQDLIKPRAAAGIVGFVSLVCSPKTPGIHPNIQKLCRAYKYVVADGEMNAITGLPGRGTQKATQLQAQVLYDRWRYSEHRPAIYLSPRDDYDVGKNRDNLHAARDACLKHGYILSLQVHKIAEIE